MSIATEIAAYQRFLREGPPKVEFMPGLGLYDGERLTRPFSPTAYDSDEEECDPEDSDVEAARYEARILKDPR